MTTAQRIRTPAEQGLIASFKEAESRSGGAEGLSHRRAAIARLAEVGLPSRWIEEWKYTDLRNAMKEAFAPAEVAGAAVAAEDVMRALGPLGALAADRLVFVDGYFSAELSSRESSSGQVVVLAARSEANVVAMPRASRGAALDGVLALNDAYATDGAVVRVTARPSKPIMLVFLHRAATPNRVTTRSSVEVGAGASLDLIEVHGRIGAAALQTSTTMSVKVGADASVRHIKVTTEGSLATHLAHCDVEVAERANYRSFQLTAGAGLARNEMHVGFTGPDAKIDLSGVFLGRGRDHIDSTLVVDHSTLGCESRELFKGVLDGQARGVFQGKVIVRPVAQKTDGKQMAKALMLSPDAEFCSKPELEIYADDVACGHGSTVAEIDPAMLFYLRSRGISKDVARAMLIESFVGEAFEKLDDEATRDALTAIAVGWLGHSAPVAA